MQRLEPPVAEGAAPEGAGAPPGEHDADQKVTATPPATPPGNEAAFEARTYPIGDALQAAQRLTPDLPRNELAAELVATVRDAFGLEDGDVQQIGDQLRIRTTPENHRRIAMYLTGLRKGVRLYIDVNADFVQVSSDDDRALADWIAAQGIKPLGEGNLTVFIIHPRQAAAFLDSATKCGSSQYLASRLRLLNGGEAQLAVEGEKALLDLPRSDEPASRLPVERFQGMSLAVKGTVWKDHRYVLFDLEPRVAYTEERSGGWEETEAHLKATFGTPVGAALVLRLPLTRCRLTAARLSQNAETNTTEVEIVRENVDDRAQPEGYVYILLKPILRYGPEPEADFQQTDPTYGEPVQAVRDSAPAAEPAPKGTGTPPPAEDPGSVVESTENPAREPGAGAPGDVHPPRPVPLAACFRPRLTNVPPRSAGRAGGVSARAGPCGLPSVPRAGARSRPSGGPTPASGPSRAPSVSR